MAFEINLKDILVEMLFATSELKISMLGAICKANGSDTFLWL